jgi:hypothetical protein
MIARSRWVGLAFLLALVLLGSVLERDSAPRAANRLDRSSATHRSLGSLETDLATSG